MYSFKSLLSILLKQLLSVYIIYALCRILFFLFNKNYFQDIDLLEFLSITFFALRFDSFSIAATNALFIILSLQPFKFRDSKIYLKILKILFILTNSLAIFVNVIDFAYFPFTQKRTTFDIINLTFGGQSEITKLIPLFLKEYWYLILIFVFFIWLLNKSYNFVIQKQSISLVTVNFKNSILSTIGFLFSLGITLVAIRGGIQRIPIVLLDAALYTKPQFIPILINTPFSILKTSDIEEIPLLTLIDESKLPSYIKTKNNADTGIFKNTNICVIILESFSKEYTKSGNRKSYTPFLDSLITKSLFFDQAFANGKTSIDGIPAILASMPSYMDRPYINSAYSNNNIETLPNLLKQKKYYSAFFHGGTNGTMNFNAFAKIAGFDDYFGRTEYNKEQDYDGQWGIWDEPFLQYMVKKVSQFQEPFFTSVFTLSSHNPYKVPEKYKNKFPKGTLIIHESIGYTDYALKLFFDEAKKQKWYSNTLFVITADHTSISEDNFYSNSIGQYAIPLLFFKENELIGVSNKTVEQIDILPSILDYLNYNRPFYSFGKSVFSNQNKPAMNYSNAHYNLINDSLYYVISNYKVTDVYNLKKDSLMKTSLLGKNTTNETEVLNYAKAFMQTYSKDLNNNTTHLTIY